MESVSSLDPLKIVQLNTWADAGGSARIAERLHLGLRGLGHEARLIAGFGKRADSCVFSVVSGWPQWKKQLRRATLAAEELLGLQYLLIWWSREFTGHPWVGSADIIQLHNLHGGYLSFRAFPILSQNKPVVWTFHDMWPLTGHCAYSFECTRWKSGCGQCPHLETYPSLRADRTALLWRLKQRAYESNRINVVAPSQWLAELVRQSPLFDGVPVHCIPNGIDVAAFRPLVKEDCRDALGLPQRRKVILFISEYLDDHRKGGQELIRGLELLDRDVVDRLLLVTVGRGAERLSFRSDVKRTDLGSIQDDALLPSIYSAADLLVCPSLIDNLPNTLVEAIACGVPGVAFKVGGVPEIVRHMETGYLALPGDTADFARGLTLLLEDDGLRRRMSERCREVAVRKFSLDLQVSSYVNLYRDVLTRWRRSPK